MKFNNSQSAFEYLYKEISTNGYESNNTIRLLNIGFYIMNPTDNLIKTNYRKWNKWYADMEFQWYLSENKSVEDIKKYAKIWDKMHNGDNVVQSNYGWQWNRNDQLKKITQILKSNNGTRRACITIYDGKEIENYIYDTPCTLTISFIIVNGKLCMSVLMRSNDLWYGFCNDQYCFSLLQKAISEELNIPIGWYYHFSIDLHIYKHFLNRDNE